MSESILEDNDERLKKVICELSMYELRKIDIEDMQLKIQELRLGDSLSAMNYEERVQTSMKCKNNDYILNEIDMLQKKIDLYTIKNKRVDNALKVLTEEERIIISRIYILKRSKSQIAKELFKSRKSIRNIENKALSKIKLA